MWRPWRLVACLLASLAAQCRALRTQDVLLGTSLREALVHKVLEAHAASPLQGGKCKEVIAKLRDMAQAKLAQGGDETAASRLLGDLADKTGEAVLHEAEEFLDTVDLRMALKVGEVMTAEDINVLVSCETGRHVRLEEHTMTPAGFPIVEGDIVVPEGNSSALMEIEKGKRWAGALWKDHTIAWCFAKDAGEYAQDAFLAALQHLSMQVPCLKFPQIDAKDEKACVSTPSLMVKSVQDDGCWSYIGAYPNGQLNLGAGCETMGIAAHELGHTLGMAHEQSRPDRDRTIDIHYDNIQEGTANNFDIKEGGWTQGHYDPYSVMHYSAEAFSKNGLPTISSKVNAAQFKDVIGQRTGYSEDDIIQIGQMYDCPVTPYLKTAPLVEAIVGKHVPAAPAGYSGEIRIFIRGVSKLHFRRWSNPDAYVKVYHKKTKVKTRHLSGTEEPTWNEGFVLNYDPSSDLTITVKNNGRSLLTHGKRLAEVVVPHKMFFPSGPCNKGCLLPVDGTSDGPQLDVCIAPCYNTGCGCKS